MGRHIRRDLFVNLELLGLYLSLSSSVTIQQLCLGLLTRLDSVSQHLLEPLRRLPGLRRVCLIHNHREPLPSRRDVGHVNERELLQRRNDDPSTPTQRISELAGVLINLYDDACCVIHRKHRVLELLIQHAPVGDHDDRIEHHPLLVVVQIR